MGVPDSYRMTFGKYKGEEIGSVPAEYLDWIADQEWIEKWPMVKQYVSENREHIDREIESADEGDRWNISPY